MLTGQTSLHLSIKTKPQHLPDGLEPPARLLERVAVHYARNVLAGEGRIPGQVPLVLGIWGPKVGGRVDGGTLRKRVSQSCWTSVCTDRRQTSQKTHRHLDLK